MQPTVDRRHPVPLFNRPAKAVTVYVLMVLLAAAFVLIAVTYFDLLARTRAVCEPLRFGQRAGAQATSSAGKDFARTFGASADELGCRK